MSRYKSYVTYTQQYNSIILKRNDEIIKDAVDGTGWCLLGKVSQKEKNRHRMFSFVCEIKYHSRGITKGKNQESKNLLWN